MNQRTNNNSRVLIGTLYCGEREYERCCSSVKQQIFENILDHITIKNLSNFEAHKSLYNYFLEKQDDYDYFIKLDADMAFTDRYAVRKIINFLNRNHKIDHLVLSVYDFMTQSSVIGVNIFSSNCCWQFDENTIFVDFEPKFPGERADFFFKKLSG